MTILVWDKPKKVLTTKEWEDNYGFEDGPKGGYMPNMSDADANSWKAKVTGTKLGYPQVEIRKTVGCQMTIIVNLGKGYNYKQYRAEDPEYFGKTVADMPKDIKVPVYYFGVAKDLQKYYRQEEIDRGATPTKGINVHMSLNGPGQMTFKDFEELHLAVEEAKQYLLDNHFCVE